MGRDYILSVIREYAFERWAEPERPLSRENFIQRSYRQWAINEIVWNLKMCPDKPSLVVIEEFMDKMERFSRRNRKAGVIFSTAFDVAADILDMLSAME